MDNVVTSVTETEQAVGALRRDLAQCDSALAGVAPVLSHLLATNGQALVSEDLVARMRGMLGNLAGSMLSAEAEATAGSKQIDSSRLIGLSNRLAGSSILVSHCYALAMEGQLTADLEERCGIDQVLTPLLQELIASTDDSIAELAMATMSAQARYVQAQRRMSLPIVELPAELFHEAVSQWRSSVSEGDQSELDRAITNLRGKFDEGNSRLGLLTRLIGAMGNGVRAALDLEHAGFALFATALARTSKQPRELAVLSCHERQATRLAIALRAAGLKPEEVRKQFLMIQNELTLPDGADLVAPETAAAMLAGTYSEPVR